MPVDGVANSAPLGQVQRNYPVRVHSVNEGRSDEPYLYQEVRCMSLINFF